MNQLTADAVRELMESTPPDSRWQTEQGKLTHYLAKDWLRMVNELTKWNEDLERVASHSSSPVVVEGAKAVSYSLKLILDGYSRDEGA